MRDRETSRHETVARETMTDMNAVQRLSKALLARQNRPRRQAEPKPGDPADWLSLIGEVARRLPPRRRGGSL